TLVEVVAAVVLLATVVTTLLTVQVRTLQQMQDVREQALAADLAHDLIAQWALQPKGFVPPSEGTFETQPGWRWIRQSTPWAGATTLKLNELTLSVIRCDANVERIVTTLTWLENKDAQ